MVSKIRVIYKENGQNGYDNNQSPSHISFEALDGSSREIETPGLSTFS
jgi:hypothetical protein